MIFNMASVRHLEFANFCILSHFRRQSHNMRLYTKFRQIRTIRG